MRCSRQSKILCLAFCVCAVPFSGSAVVSVPSVGCPPIFGRFDEVGICQPESSPSQDDVELTSTDEWNSDVLS